MTDEEDLYSLLGCKENASFEEIKKCYHEKALNCHPDKGASDLNFGYSFDKINKAWKTLSDPEERQKYNAKLSQVRLAQQNLVFGTYRLQELTVDIENGHYSLMCRCGGQYLVGMGDITPGDDCDISVECDTCSLVINIKLC